MYCALPIVAKRIKMYFLRGCDLEKIACYTMFFLCCALTSGRADFPREFSSQPFRSTGHSYPCTPVDSVSFGSAIACTLKITSTKSVDDDDDGESELGSQVPQPTYVKVSAPLLYKPLPRTSSLIFIAPPIVKSASAIVATEPQTVEKDIQYMAYPKYSFNYGVIDGYTGDSKSAWEERDGDTVKGEYSVVEADGTIRTVSYMADDHNGFNAVVTRSEPPKNTESAVEVKTFVPSAIYPNDRHKIQQKRYK